MEIENLTHVRAITFEKLKQKLSKLEIAKLHYLGVNPRHHGWCAVVELKEEFKAETKKVDEKKSKLEAASAVEEKPEPKKPGPARPKK